MEKMFEQLATQNDQIFFPNSVPLAGAMNTNTNEQSSPTMSVFLLYICF